MNWRCLLRMHDWSPKTLRALHDAKAKEPAYVGFRKCCNRCGKLSV